MKYEHTIHTNPEALNALAECLHDFSTMAPELALLNGSGGLNKFSLVTDGQYAVLVNAEGYDYPRYRGPRIAMALVDELTLKEMQQLCLRKTEWKSGLAIESRKTLDVVLANPHSFTA